MIAQSCRSTGSCAPLASGGAPAHPAAAEPAGTSTGKTDARNPSFIYLLISCAQRLWRPARLAAIICKIETHTAPIPTHTHTHTPPSSNLGDHSCFPAHSRYLRAVISEAGPPSCLSSSIRHHQRKRLICNLRLAGRFNEAVRGSSSTTHPIIPPYPPPNTQTRP